MFWRIGFIHCKSLFFTLFIVSLYFIDCKQSVPDIWLVFFVLLMIALWRLQRSCQDATVFHNFIKLYLSEKSCTLNTDSISLSFLWFLVHNFLLTFTDDVIFYYFLSRYKKALKKQSLSCLCNSSVFHWLLKVIINKWKNK